MQTTNKRGAGVFISYSHRDSEWLDRLRVHLRPLEREFGIDFWDDTRISSGSKWKKEIENALQVCKIAVLLVSADFLASEFVANDELPPLLTAAADEDTVILPLILSPSRFLRTKSLSQFQAVNDPMKPLITLTRGEQEDILDRVAQRIEVLLAQFPEPAQNIVDDSPGASRRTSSENFGQMLDEFEREQQAEVAPRAQSRGQYPPPPQTDPLNVDTSDKIYHQLRAIVVENLGVDEDEVVPSATVLSDLGADSLDGVEMVMAAEETFGIRIADGEAANITTVGDAYRCIKSKLKWLK